MTLPDKDLDLRRVAVVGTSCSGKTTFARELAAALQVPTIELDALYWGPGWAEFPAAEFHELVQQRASAERWVSDGNYSMVRDVLWARATHVIWLNYSFAVVFSRALSRTVHWAVTQEELFSGNRESIRNSFFSLDSILVWVLRTFRRNRLRYAALRVTDEWKHIRFVEFRKPPAASEFLARCHAARNSQPAS